LLVWSESPAVQNTIENNLHLMLICCTI
jgi:hypothetical protein